MSEELQNETVVEDDSTEQVEDQNIGVELATTSEVEHEEKPQVDDAEAKAAKAQKATQEVINKKHREAREAERKAAELQSRLDEIERREQEKIAASVANIPDLPIYPADSFDDDYDQQVSDYHQAVANRDAQIQAKAQFDANQNILAQQQQYQQQQAAQAIQLENQKVIQDHNSRVSALGINPDEMVAAENAVISYGLPPELLAHIAKDADSPLLVKYLGGSAQDGYELANMARTNPYGVSALLDEIKVKAGALKPKTTNAPKPTQEIKGGGAKPDNNYPNSAGGKFY